jgi:ABC-type multidrug transport system ATPase subunit
MMHHEDSFFSMLTVRETLDFYLNLQKYSASTVTSVTSINELLGTLNLLGVQNSMVGSRVDSSDGKSQRGISGGEQKRLALACALLHRPRVLIADEPTSGLDSHHALQVVQQLRNLAQQRDIAVICSLHQPPSSIWALLDDVLVIAPLGRVAYFGPRADVLPYLEGLGLGCPPHTNPAEHLLEVVSPQTSGGESARNASEERIQHIVNAFLDHQSDFRAHCSGGTADAVSVGPIRSLRSQRPPVLTSISGAIACVKRWR